MKGRKRVRHMKSEAVRHNCRSLPCCDFAEKKKVRLDGIDAVGATSIAMDNDSDYILLVAHALFLCSMFLVRELLTKPT